MVELRIVGKKIRRLDSLAKVTGEAKYTADLKWPGMLYGTILRSPCPHAKIISIDCQKAKALKGVKAIVTALDTPKRKFGPCIPDEYLFAVDRVRYIGDEVAAVAATDQETADEALELIEVRYERLPAVFDVFEALSPEAPEIDSIAGKNLAQRYTIKRGDTETGFGESAHILEETFQLPSVSQCCLEPTTCTAIPDQQGRLTIWAPAQAPFVMRNQIARALGVPHGKIRVIQATVGGAFGSRHRVKVAIIAALLARQTSKPVRITLEREEEFLASRPRMAATIKLRMGFAGDGTILAKKAEIVADNGAYTGEVPWLLETTARRVDSLYRIKNVETEASLVYTNKVPTGAFRGFGNPQMHFALESMLDMAADRIGIDPMELRLKNATQTGDTTVHGNKISSCGLVESIRTAASAADWGKYSSVRGFHQKGRKRRGLGMACMIHIAGRRTQEGFSGSSAEVRILENERVVITSGEADVGQGSSSAFAQIAAEVLELPLEAIEIASLDTDQCPFAWGSYSDRVTIFGGGAVRLAALDARSQILSLAARYFGVAEDQLGYEQGTIFCQTSGSRIGLFRLIQILQRQHGGFALVGKAAYCPPLGAYDPESRYGNLGASHTFATQVADVEVDLDTGQIKVLSFVCAHDLGAAINPLAAEGQVEGALLQGIGYALMEELPIEEGQAKGLSFLDYKIPTTMEVPPSKVFLIESQEPNGPFGAKGVGEPGLVPTAPAIVNAIYQATGARITSLPIIPEKVLAALEKKKRIE